MLVTGFKSQSMLLARMFYFIEAGKITEAVYTQEQAPPGTANKDFLRGFIATLLQNAFANLQPYVIYSIILQSTMLTSDSPVLKSNPSSTTSSP